MNGPIKNRSACLAHGEPRRRILAANGSSEGISMSIGSKARYGLAAVAGVAALGLGAQAQAQSYGYYGNNAYGNSYYDPCSRSSGNRGIAGGLLGGAIGASVGANAAARNNRQDGALLGGALGAIAGAVIGNKTAGCNSGSSYNRQGYYNGYSYPQSGYSSGYGYGAGYGSGYGAGYDNYNRGYSYNDRTTYRYGSSYDDGYAYGRNGARYRMSNRQAGADGCSLAESPIHMPDGRTQMRYVRVCMDDNGRYQVVD